MNRRIAGYDLARSVALFGLVVANFSRGVEHTDYGLSRFIQTRLHSGGSVATLLVLGGVGISLLTQRVRITSDAHGIADNRKRLIKRAASLLVVGICCNLIWSTGFLSFYSICIVIGALLLAVSNRSLWLLAFVFVAICVVFLFFVYHYFNYYEVILNSETFPDGDPWTVKGMVFRLYHNGLHARFSWTVFLLIGMWIGRQEVHHPKVRRNMFLGGIVVALVAECILWMLIFGVPWLLRSLSIWEWNIENFMTLFMTLGLFAKCGTTTAIIGGCLMLTESIQMPSGPSRL